jgi:cullin-associated NEDD8-dissociated protein 1
MSCHMIRISDTCFAQIVTKSSHGQLETVADALWGPLFDDAENAEETTRNVAAASLGKLTTTHPDRYLAQLHARIRDADPRARATVVSAIRYTFSGTSNAQADAAYEELLAPLIVDFLSLIVDSDLVWRLFLSRCSLF